MSETYTREDMARAWSEGYAARPATSPALDNPYSYTAGKRLSEFELPDDYVSLVKGKVL